MITVSGSSPNAHSHKQTALLTAALNSQNPVFLNTHKNCILIFYFLVGGQLKLWTPFLLPKCVHSCELPLYLHVLQHKCWSMLTIFVISFSPTQVHQCKQWVFTGAGQWSAALLQCIWQTNSKYHLGENHLQRQWEWCITQGYHLGFEKHQQDWGRHLPLYSI